MTPKRMTWDEIEAAIDNQVDAGTAGDTEDLADTFWQSVKLIEEEDANSLLAT